METVTIPATFDAGLTFAEGREHVRRVGKIFECGDYPDKAFSLTEEEATAAAAAFTPVPLDLEHLPTVLDGKLGRLVSVEAVGGTDKATQEATRTARTAQARRAQDE